MQGAAAPLWLALAGAALQLVSLGTDFYVWDGVRQTAWFGVPHTSELILLSALVTVFLAVLVAADRSPIAGRTAGLAIGIIGLLATLQLSYRMVVPPFGGRVPDHAAIIGDSCLYYCLPSQAQPADILIGMWMALLGCLTVTVSGFAYAHAQADQRFLATPWRAEVQPEMNPWLALAALGAIGQFVFGYTFFTFYKTLREGGATTWSGWLPAPHTASLVLAVTVAVVGLVWSVMRGRSPLGPLNLGATIAVLGFMSVMRIAYRVLQPPFGNQPVEIGPAAYLALASAVLIVVAGCVQAKLHYGGNQLKI